MDGLSWKTPWKWMIWGYSTTIFGNVHINQNHHFYHLQIVSILGCWIYLVSGDFSESVLFQIGIDKQICSMFTYRILVGAKHVRPIFDFRQLAKKKTLESGLPQRNVSQFTTYRDTAL